MSHYLDWKVVGFYDGKILAVQNDIHPGRCVFLDMEIYRKDVRSIGQHMLLYNKNHIPTRWEENFESCLNPNLIRGYDANSHFARKYPLATVHLLLCVLSHSLEKRIVIQDSAIPLLFYADGTFKNLLNYPENCISWLEFLGAKNPSTAMYKLMIAFANRKIGQIMHKMKEIFMEFQGMADGRRGGDKIRIEDIQKERAEKLLSMLSRRTCWKFSSERWALQGLEQYPMEKQIENTLNIEKFQDVLGKNPLSFAITGRGGKQFEYTLGVFPQR